MSFELRPYQVETLEKIHNALQNQQEVLLQAIMGAGKTVIICRLINRYYKETDRNFLVLAHKQELIRQFEDTFKKMTDIPFYDIGISCSGLKQKDIKNRVTIASVQTFINQADSFGFVNLCVIDEAHRIDINDDTEYKKIIDILKSHNAQLRIIGITATPYRLGHGFIYGNRCKEKNINLFRNLTHKITYKELVDDGYLMPLEGLVKCSADLKKDIEAVGKNGDFIINQLDGVMTKTVHIKAAAEAINLYCNEYRHICIFCCTINHAEMIQQAVGDSCTIVHSKLSDIEREQNMQAWRTGKKRCIASVNILIEGFDFPALDCLVIIRPTMSTSLFLQAVGRVLRTAPEKEKAFLLDLTDNTDRFGTDLDNIKVNIPKLTNGDPMLKECPNCHEFVHIARMECDCGYLFPVKEAEESDLKKIDLKTVNFSKTEPNFLNSEPEIYDITRVEIARHKKEGRPDSVKLAFYNDNLIRSYVTSDWLCFEHGGKAEKFAKKKWRQICCHPAYIPETTDEALSVLSDYMVATPLKIQVIQDGRYLRVQNVISNPEKIEMIGMQMDDDDINDIPF